MTTRSLFILIAFLINFKPPCSGQVKADTLKTEKTDLFKIIGTYYNESPRFNIKFKKNNTFKITFAAPRPIISKGEWQTRHDTLICNITHINTVLQGDNTRLKEHPKELKFIIEEGELLMLIDEFGKTTTLHFKKPQK